MTQTIAACNCTRLSTKLISQFTSTLIIYVQSNAIDTGEYLVGSDVVAMACMSTHLQAALPIGKGVEHYSRKDRVCLVCSSG